ncbi:MAG: 4Fe-4S ferredoxin, partial [Desulfobacteraceae bacterium]|nr:4Fe-4S ferredoxin [Desulfobacteraceae bacterium]
PDYVLPKQIMDREIKRLKALGVVFSIAPSAEVFAGAPGFDAMFIGYDTTTPFSCPDLDQTKKDTNTLQTHIPHVFVGGFSPQMPLNLDHDYPIAHAAQGRKAATSMDRFMSQVSMTAGRDREGAISTRLSTDITGIDFSPPISTIAPIDKDHGKTDPNPLDYDIDRAAQEAQRCIQCLCSRCLRTCTYLQEFKGHPGQYAREIYNNAAIVMGERTANLLINSCSQCNLCQTICPNDFSMADLTRSARLEMVKTNKMPESAHEFALDHMDWASSDVCFFACHAPSKNQSFQIFFPGCQLMGSSPDQVKQVYQFLLARNG